MLCYFFVIRFGPHELAMTLISANNFASIKCLIQVIVNNFSAIVQIESAVLMMGCLSRSTITGDKLVLFGGIEIINSALLENVSDIKVYSLWMKRAIVNLQSLAAMASGQRKMSIEHLVDTIEKLQRIAAFDTPKVEVALTGPVTQPDHIDDQNYWPTIWKKKRKTLVQRLKSSPLNKCSEGGQLLPSFPVIEKLPVLEKKKIGSVKKKNVVMIETKATGLQEEKGRKEPVVVVETVEPVQEKVITTDKENEYSDVLNKVANRLFLDTAEGIPADGGGGSAIDSLDFAERLTLMIMQVQGG
jgi:hypothetical protein